MKNKPLVFLAIIVFLGAFLRLSFLSQYPPSLNWDEISHGYNAYSILKTGRDEWGQLLPLANFRAYGDYPLPLNLYLTIPFIATLGLNEFAIRLPHALLGTLTIIATYYLVLGVTKKRWTALVASLLIAIEPWTLFTSRFVVQSNLSVFFLTVAAALFFNRDKNKYFVPLSTLSLGLTLYSYHTTRIFSPLILLGALIVYRESVIKEIKRRTRVFWLTLIILIIFFVPLIYVLTRPESRARSSVVFILDQGAINRLEESRNNSKLPTLIGKIIYNKPVYLVEKFADNYLGYFSPQFLFLKGGTQYQFSIPDYGLLSLVNLPFFYIGLIILAKKSFKEKDYRLILAWILLSPIPASITQEKFAVLRSTAMLPLPQLLSSMGFFFVFDWLSKKKRVSMTSGAIAIIYLILLWGGLETYGTKYVLEYPKNYSWAWQYGYKEAVNFVKDSYNKYDKIIVTKKYGEPHEFFLFYMQYDPTKYRNDSNLNRFYQSNWYWVDGFDKFYFVNDWQVKDKEMTKQFILESKRIVDCNNTKCLLITSPGNFPAGWKKLNTINFLDGSNAFEMYEN